MDMRQQMARKIKKRDQVKKNYEMQIAGRLWRIPEITFQEEEGKLFINQDEIKRWHLAAANVICSDKQDLTVEEFKFLVDLTDKKYVDIAKFLQIDPSTISNWNKKGEDLSFAYSFVLKLWLWSELFEDKRTIDLHATLKNNAEYAVSNKLVSKIEAA